MLDFGRGGVKGGMGKATQRRSDRATKGRGRAEIGEKEELREGRGV
jgi:hypothetical protein